MGKTEVRVTWIKLGSGTGRINNYMLQCTDNVTISASEDLLQVLFDRIASHSDAYPKISAQDLAVNSEW